MKKIINIFLILILIPFGWSCSEKVMDNINKDVNDATDVASKYVITDVMTSSAFNVTGNDFAFYSSVYIEHNVGIYGQMFNAEIRSGQPTSTSTYNNTWLSVYQNLLNAKVVIKKCSAGGSEAGNYQTLGIAQILTAYNLAILTDMFGDVPWTEALQPGVIFTPKLDKQSDIYQAIFKLLDDAIVNLNTATTYPPLGTQDFIYAGKSNLWIKFAYGLQARYLMHLSLKDPKYADVITAANNSFTSSAEQCLFKYNGTTSTSPMYDFFTDRNYFGASQSLHDKLVARNDPRDTIYFKVAPKAGDQTTIVFAPNGTPNQIQNVYSISALSNITAPTYLMSYHELEFLKAEAYARLNDLPNAEIELKKAITAAFTKIYVGIKADSIALYAARYYNNEIKTKFTSNPLSEIMNQKYIAFFEEESIEAYNDYRRLRAMGNNFIVLENSLNTTKFPLRFTYGSADVTTNSTVADAEGDGTYVYTENVWWAGGTR
jgi:hypothetical protein